jgi:hypothetical protein
MSPKVYQGPPFKDTIIPLIFIKLLLAGSILTSKDAPRRSRIGRERKTEISSVGRVPQLRYQ